MNAFNAAIQRSLENQNNTQFLSFITYSVCVLHSVLIRFFILQLAILRGWDGFPLLSVFVLKQHLEECSHNRKEQRRLISQFQCLVYLWYNIRSLSHVRKGAICK